MVIDNNVSCKNTGQDVIYLASCAVNNRKPDQSMVETMNLEDVYAIARAHSVAAMIAAALESVGYKEVNSGKAIATAIRRLSIYEKTYSDIKMNLEEQGIWYMPLKGAVIKDYYPKSFMREFSDYDIMIDPKRAEDVKNIMEKLGFYIYSYGVKNDDIYFKEPCLNFEMHRYLYDSGYEEQLYDNYKIICGYYEHVENKLLGEEYEKQFSPEDFYIYMIAHEYKHYSKHGIGLRALLDIYVFCSKEKLDMDYISVEMGKMGLSDFEKKNRELSMTIFGEDEPAEYDHEMLDYIMSSGTHGSYEHLIQNKIRHKKWNKIYYTLYRLSVPVSPKNAEYKAFAQNFPVFYKHKMLLPILPFYRVIRSIKAGHIKWELNVVKKS